MASRICLVRFLICLTISSGERPSRKSTSFVSSSRTAKELTLLSEAIAVEASVQNRERHRNNTSTRQPKVAPPQHADLAAITSGEFKNFYHMFFGGIPKSAAPVPYTKSKPPVCGPSLECDANRLGVGRKLNWAGWASHLVWPPIMILVIAFGISMKPGAQANINVRTNFTVIAMVLTEFLVFWYCKLHVKLLYASDGNRGEVLIHLFVLRILLISSMIMALWFADVEFTWPTLKSGVYLHVVSVVYIAIFETFLFVMHVFRIYLSMLQLLAPAALIGELCAAISFSKAALIPRNAGYAWNVYLEVKILVVNLYYWGDTTGSSPWFFVCVFFPQFTLRPVFMMLCYLAPYSRDRYFIAAFGYLTTVVTRIGLYRTDQGHTFEIWVRIAQVVIATVLCGIGMRYQVALPDAIQKIRFLRLEYIREVLNEGRMIVRCQEQPESAFGNPAKVKTLIIVSHHWLDGIKCDVATPECPHGLRLTTMLQRLEIFFPSKWPGASAFYRPLSAFAEAVVSAQISEYDVLVFWDYPCMPQIGTAPDGSLIQRTENEQAVFKEVLPACGLLYTMFPVMICPEVTDDVSPYSASGWCFCEQEQAQLCGTLQPYSEEFRILDTSAISVEHIEAGLKDRQFRTEDDRDVVRNIVMGTYLRRQLLASVIAQDFLQVQTLLQQVEAHNLKHTIDYPVDSQTLDTLLHVAWKRSTLLIRQHLIDYGANPERPNHRGEKAGQFFIFPRSWIPCL